MKRVRIFTSLIKTIPCIQQKITFKITRHIVATLSLWMVLISPLCVRANFVMKKNANYKGPVTHGMSKTKTYRSWSLMKARCLEHSKKREYYYDRGISVCDRWLNSFTNFLEDMGEKPTIQHSIDRINNDGNYEPSNCRWATMKEQCANRRNPVQRPRNYKIKREFAQYDLQMNFIKTFTAVHAIAVALGKSSVTSIKKCISGEQKSAYGFIFKQIK